MMQPQGLGALMPQGAQQQAPQMNNPRLNAAVDVVSSDAEKAILDPRTLAMLKYKDALQAMQAADQMMAMAQPQAMPTTVAERTKQAAEQGIAGLASRLSPGIQQQGGQMQAAQLQQAMSGGLPQLPAPNMARMAGGGIVAFEAGGGIEGEVDRPNDTIIGYYSDGSPIYASDVARMDNAGAIDETPEGAERRARYAALQETGQQSRADILGAARRPIAIAPTEQETAAEPRGRGGYGLDEMFTDAKGGIASLINRARPVVSGFMRNIPEISEEDLLAATTSTGPLTRAVPAPATPAPAQRAPAPVEEPRTSQPAPQDMGPNATPAQWLLANAGGSQDAVAAALEAEAQPRAGESAAAKDARMRRLIAGLRGFGAQGLGGFAAGSAEEELRAEQELTAEQERERRAAMETRELDLEERNITLQDEINRQQIAQQQRADNELLQYRYDQLNQRQQEAVDAAVNEETATLRQAIQALDALIPTLEDGWVKKERSDALAQRESLVQQFLAARARIIAMYDGTQYAPAGGGGGLAPGDEALVSEYLNR